MKSTVDQIRERFDHDVERFSDLNVAQRTAIDSGYCLDLIAESVAAAAVPQATGVLDVGCGAGNWTLKLLKPSCRACACTLTDLSRPMLDRAGQRVRAAGGDGGRDGAGRRAGLRLRRRFGSTCHRRRRGAASFAGAGGVGRGLRQVPPLAAAGRGRVGVRHGHARGRRPCTPCCGSGTARICVGLGGEAMADRVFAYIEPEDTPRPVTWQLDRLRAAGFRRRRRAAQERPVRRVRGVQGVVTAECRRQTVSCRPVSRPDLGRVCYARGGQTPRRRRPRRFTGHHL